MCDNQCGHCKNNTIKSTGYTVTVAVFNILTTFTDTDVENGDCYKLILCVNLPSITTIVPVTVMFNGVQIPLLDKLGNVVMSDQLNTRRCYQLVYGANLPHLLVCNCIPRSVFLPIPVAPPVVV